VKDQDFGIPALTSPNPVRHFLSSIENKFDIYEKYGIGQYGEVFIASVSRNYRGQGLATELYRRSFSIFRKNGDKFIKCLVTNPGTRKVVASLKFEELGSWKFSEATDEDGNLLIPDMAGREDGIFAMTVLKL